MCKRGSRHRADGWYWLIPLPHATDRRVEVGRYEFEETVYDGDFPWRLSGVNFMYSEQEIARDWKIGERVGALDGTKETTMEKSPNLSRHGEP